MPTLQLPRDDRWGELGAGLGNILSAVVQGVRNRQVTQGVSQIWSDPQVPDDQKLVQALRLYGDQGGQVGMQLLKAKTLAAQLQDFTAQTAERGAHAKYFEAEAATKQAELPFAAQLEQARIAAEGGKVPLQQAQTMHALAGAEKEQAETSLVPSRLQSERQLAGERAASTEQKQTETDIKKIELGQMQGAMTPGGGQHPLDIALAAVPNLDDVGKTRAKTAYDTLVRGGLPPKDATKFALEQAGKDATLKELKEPVEKTAADATQSASAMKRFMTSFNTAASQFTPTGIASGAPFKAWLEGKGFSSGDTELLTMQDTALRGQAEAVKSTGGGGFMSALRLKFAKDLAPNLMDSPLRNVINVDVMADARLAELRSRLAAQPPKTIVEPLKEAIANWEDVKRQTQAYQTYVTPKGETVLTHEGSMLNPRNFKPVIDASKSYTTRQGTTYKGSDLTAIARTGIPGAPTPLTGDELKRLLGISDATR